MTLTVGIGFTVIEKVCAMPEQEFDMGVTTMKEVIGTFVALVPVKAAIVDVPDNGIKPILAVELVH
jgi:hypothetical protein